MIITCFIQSCLSGKILGVTKTPGPETRGNGPLAPSALSQDVREREDVECSSLFLRRGHVMVGGCGEGSAGPDPRAWGSRLPRTRSARRRACAGARDETPSLAQSLHEMRRRGRPQPGEGTYTPPFTARLGRPPGSSARVEGR